MVQPVSNRMARFIETDISTRIFRLSSGINEALMTAANEPSLGLYRLQEHSVNTIPKLVKERQNLDEITERVKGVNFDLTYDIQAVQDISRVTNFDTILFDLKKAIEIKQLLTRKEIEVRQRVQATPTTRPGYGSTGESPPILRRGGPHSINAIPTQMGEASGKNSLGILIEPKKF